MNKSNTIRLIQSIYENKMIIGFGVIMVIIAIILFKPIKQEGVNTENVKNSYYEKALNLVPSGSTLIKYNVNSCTAKLGDKYLLITRIRAGLFSSQINMVEIDSNAAYSLASINDNTLSMKTAFDNAEVSMIDALRFWAFIAVFSIGILIIVIPVIKGFLEYSKNDRMRNRR